MDSEEEFSADGTRRDEVRQAQAREAGDAHRPAVPRARPDPEPHPDTADEQSALARVRAICNDDPQVIETLLGTAQRIAGRLPSSDALDRYVMERLNEQMLNFSTAPSAPPTPRTLGVLPRALVDEVDALIGAWKDEVLVRMDAEPVDAADPVAVNTCALACLSDLFKNRYQSDHARRVANLVNVAIRTGIVTLITATVHRLASLYWDSAEGPGAIDSKAVVGLCGLGYASCITVARLVQGLGRDSAKSRACSVALLCMSIGTVLLAAQAGLFWSLAGLMGVRVLTSIFRDNANGIFALSNNTRGLFVGALSASGVLWALANVAELFVTGPFEALARPVLDDSAGNVTQSQLLEFDSDLQAFEFTRVLLGAGVYAIGEIFDDIVQPLVQSAWEQRTLKRETRASIFIEEEHQQMIERLERDAIELLAATSAERPALAARNNNDYVLELFAFLARKRDAVGLSLAEATLLTEFQPGEIQRTIPVVGRLKHYLSKTRLSPVAFDLTMLDLQLGALIDHFADRQDLSIARDERDLLVREFFVKAYISSYGYIARTPLIDEIQRQQAEQKPGARPRMLRAALEEARQAERARAIEKLRVRLVYRPPSSQGVVRALTHAAPMRIVFYFLAFGLYLLIADALDKAYGRKKAPWYEPTGFESVGLLTAILTGYVFYYLTFHSSKVVSTPNQTGGVALSDYVYDAHQDKDDDSYPEDDVADGQALGLPARQRDEGTDADPVRQSALRIDLQRLLHDGALEGLGGMAAFSPMVWNSHCIFLEPRSRTQDPALRLRVVNTIQMYETGNLLASRLDRLETPDASFSQIADRLNIKRGPNQVALRAGQLRLRSKAAGEDLEAVADRGIVGFEFELGEDRLHAFAVIARDKRNRKVFYLAVFNLDMKVRLNAGTMTEAIAEAAGICAIGEAGACQLIYPAKALRHHESYPVHDFSGHPAASSLRAEANAWAESAFRTIKRLVSREPAPRTVPDAGESMLDDVTAWGEVAAAHNQRQVLHLRCPAGEPPEPALVAMLSRYLRGRGKGRPKAPPLLSPASDAWVTACAAAGRPRLVASTFRREGAPHAWSASLPVDLRRQKAVALSRLEAAPARRVGFVLVRSRSLRGKFILVNPQQPHPLLIDAQHMLQALPLALAWLDWQGNFDLITAGFEGCPLLAPIRLSVGLPPLVAALKRHAPARFAPTPPALARDHLAPPNRLPHRHQIYRERQTASECGVCASNALLMYLDPQASERRLAFDEVRRFLAAHSSRHRLRYDADTRFVTLAEIKQRFDAVPTAYPRCAHLTLSTDRSWPFGLQCAASLVPDLQDVSVACLTYMTNGERQPDMLDHTIAIARDRVDSTIFHLLDSLSGSARHLQLASASMNEAIAAFMADVPDRSTFELLVPLAAPDAHGTQLMLTLADDRPKERRVRIERATAVLARVPQAQRAALARRVYWQVEALSLPLRNKDLGQADAQLDADRHVLLEALVAADMEAGIDWQPADITSQWLALRTTWGSPDEPPGTELALQRGGVAMAGFRPASMHTIFFARDRLHKKRPVLCAVNTLLMYLHDNDPAFLLEAPELPALGSALPLLRKGEHHPLARLQLRKGAGRGTQGFEALPAQAEVFAADVMALRIECAPNDAGTDPFGLASALGPESESGLPSLLVIARDRRVRSCIHCLDLRSGRSRVLAARDMASAMREAAPHSATAFELLYPSTSSPLSDSSATSSAE